MGMPLNKRVETVVDSRLCGIEVDKIRLQDFHLTANMQRNVKEQRIITFKEEKRDTLKYLLLNNVNNKIYNEIV